jgi:hypothetical protein
MNTHAYRYEQTIILANIYTSKVSIQCEVMASLLLCICLRFCNNSVEMITNQHMVSAQTACIIATTSYWALTVNADDKQLLQDYTEL